MSCEFGTVGIKDIDRGVMETFGGVLVDMEIDGDVRQAYAVKVDGLIEYPDEEGFTEELRPLPAYPAGMVPVFFMNPEEVFQPFILPCVVIRRSDFTPNYSRAPWYGPTTVPACDAKLVSIKYGNQILTGYDKHVTKDPPVPFDMAYEVQTMARLMNDEVILLTQMLRVAKPPYFTTYIRDSNGQELVATSGPVAVSDTSELADVSDRTLSHMISFDVWACLDLGVESAGIPTVTSFPEVTYKAFYPPPVVRPKVYNLIAPVKS